MSLDDFRFVRKPGTNDIEYMEWTEGLTKTRQGGLVKQNRGVMQWVFPSGDDQCCVKLLELQMCKGPAKFHKCGPLYWRPPKKLQPALWYTEQPVGESKIKEFMKTIAKKAGLDNSGKRFTNHSVQKTQVRKLQKGGEPNDKITAITGRKSEQSIAEYPDTDIEDHRRISLLISHNAAASQPTVPHSSPYNQPAPLSILNGHQPLQPIQQG